MPHAACQAPSAPPAGPRPPPCSKTGRLRAGACPENRPPDVAVQEIRSLPVNHIHQLPLAPEGHRHSLALHQPRQSGQRDLLLRSGPSPGGGGGAWSCVGGARGGRAGRSNRSQVVSRCQKSRKNLTCRLIYQLKTRFSVPQTIPNPPSNLQKASFVHQKCQKPNQSLRDELSNK